MDPEEEYLELQGVHNVALCDARLRAYHINKQARNFLSFLKVM